MSEHRVHVHFESDCGKLSQTVTVSRHGRDTPAIPPTGRQVLLSWVRSALGRAVDASSPRAVLQQEELEETTLRAFSQLGTTLVNVDGRWVTESSDDHPSVLFETQLRGSPITEPYDLEMLVRVLLEIARANSECRAEERSFLSEVVEDPQLIARLANAPNVTVAELAEVSSVQVKQTILMLAWTMAYADGELDTQEMARLAHLCRGFMLPESRVKRAAVGGQAVVARSLSRRGGRRSWLCRVAQGVR